MIAAYVFITGEAAAEAVAKTEQEIEQAEEAIGEIGLDAAAGERIASPIRSALTFRFSSRGDRPRCDHRYREAPIPS